MQNVKSPIVISVVLTIGVVCFRSGFPVWECTPSWRSFLPHVQELANAVYDTLIEEDSSENSFLLQPNYSKIDQ